MVDFSFPFPSQTRRTHSKQKKKANEGQPCPLSSSLRLLLSFVSLCCDGIQANLQGTEASPLEGGKNVHVAAPRGKKKAKKKRRSSMLSNLQRLRGAPLTVRSLCTEPLSVAALASRRLSNECSTPGTRRLSLERGVFGLQRGAEKRTRGPKKERKRPSKRENRDASLLKS